jgi:hypothetical protein
VPPLKKGAQGKRQRQMTLASVDNRLARLRDLDELGDLSKPDHLSRREALQRERESLTAPLFVRERTALRSLCDG